jgi:hypothetical protein
MPISPQPTPSSSSGEWPIVPPAPTPVKFAPIVGGEPPIINPDVNLIPAVATIMPPPLLGSAAARRTRATTETIPPLVIPPSPGISDESPLAALRRSLRRQAASRRSAGELVWQPRFAYASALVILFALTVVSMPLWIVLYRLVGTSGPGIGDVMALCMMLLGGFLTGAAAWVIIIEMRGRVRMVDTLAKTGEREVTVAPAAPELPVLDAPLDHVVVHPIGAPPPIAPRAEAQQVSAAATLEASSKLLASFSSVLKSFGQLPAQVAMLTVALGLFVGATVLSLN